MLERWICCKWIMLSMYWIAGRKGTRRRRRRSRFEVIAVNQLSCGARDSLSEGMRDAQIAITELLHLCTEMISSHPHIPIVQLRR